MKIVFVALGFIFFGIGSIGAIMPVLPTAPFLVLAALCFAKGSERLNRWFLNTSTYKNHLERFIKTRSMTMKTKWIILFPVSVMLVTVIMLMNHLPGRIVIVILMTMKYYFFIFRIKTTKPASEK